MKDNSILNFGKYKGRMLGQIPADYLLWLNDQMKGKKSPFAMEFKEYIEDNMQALKMEIDNNKPQIWDIGVV